MNFADMLPTDDLDTLLPHRRPMRLIDRLIDGDQTFAVSETLIRADDPFVDADRGVPAWALLEYFAQTAALIGGIEAANAGGSIPQGLLLGTRKLVCGVSHIPLGATMKLEARQEFSDGAGMSAYRCKTLHDEWPVECVLSVYAPKSVEKDTP
ncbi:MAG: hypothetical protein AAGA84_02140 [Pseudomonadota bacterium]